MRSKDRHETQPIGSVALAAYATKRWGPRLPRSPVSQQMIRAWMRDGIKADHGTRRLPSRVVGGRRYSTKAELDRFVRDVYLAPPVAVLTGEEVNTATN